MTPFTVALEQQLDDIRGQNLRRELARVDSPPGARIVMGGETLLNFSSNDYLGLANEPALKEAAQKAIADFGAGAGASRLLGGSLAPSHELEETLAAFKGTESALTFSTGYATALGTAGALMGKDDVILLDKLAHACLVDAARLCGATLRVFKHNDLNRLEHLLQWADTRRRSTLQTARVPQHTPRVLIVTESVFSMDGDRAPLPELIALKEQYGAWLLLDEAHATGLFGPQRRGLAEALGVADRVEIQMGTLGKALGASGGYICGPRALTDLLVNRARSFIFSTAPVPAAAAAATAGIRWVQSAAGQHRCAQLWNLVRQLRVQLPPAGWPMAESPSAIIPLRVGAEPAALELAAALRHRNLFMPAVRYPTVARGAARLRLTLTATHTADDLAVLLAGLSEGRPAVESVPHA